jgi:hypothetical protein
MVVTRIKEIISEQMGAIVDHFNEVIKQKEKWWADEADRRLLAAMDAAIEKKIKAGIESRLEAAAMAGKKK